jgi:hypothetical protein
MTEEFPKDGTTFVTEVVERATYRWTRYKPDGARQMGKPGRFQKMVWKGDFFKWGNAEPEGYLVQGDKGPLQERDEAHLAKDAEIERLRDALQAARDWIGDLRGCIGDVEFTTFDMRDPSKVEEETMAKIDAALSKQESTNG